MSEPKETITFRFRGNDDACANGEVPPWVRNFLAALIVTGSLRQALDEAKIDLDNAWALRRAEPEFAKYWDMAVRANTGLRSGLAFGDAIEAAEAGVN